MKSRTTKQVWAHYHTLPVKMRVSAINAYQLWRDNPHHLSLQLKNVHTTRPIYSVRVSMDERALGLLEGDAVVWFWIGSHADYDRLLR